MAPAELPAGAALLHAKALSLKGPCCCRPGPAAKPAQAKPAVAKLHPPRKQPRLAAGAPEGSAPRSGPTAALAPEAVPPPQEKSRAAGGGTAAGAAPARQLAPVHYLGAGAQRGRRLGDLNLAACSSFRCSTSVCAFHWWKPGRRVCTAGNH